MELNCSDFFYYNLTSGKCRPVCEWTPFRVGIEITIIEGILVALAILVSPTYILLALTIKRDW